MNVLDRLRAMLDPRPPRGLTAERVGRATFHYRPGPVAWPGDDRLTAERAARILWSPTALTITDAQLDRVATVLGLTDRPTATATGQDVDRDQLDRDRATGHPADRDRLTATATGQDVDRDRVTATATGQDVNRDRVTATDRPSPGDREPVSPTAGPTATATGDHHPGDRETGHQGPAQGVA